MQRARAFRAANETYERVRPNYPEAIVAAVAHLAPSGGHVVDCGAGTGKFTRQLVRHGLSVTAVEPAEAMSDQLRAAVETESNGASFKGMGVTSASTGTNTAKEEAENGTGARETKRIRIVRATGEATGLAQACADVVVYAQAWHWVDEPAATAEAARILKPDGSLALVWNQFDVSIPWVHRLTRIMRSGDIPRRCPDLSPVFDPPQRLAVAFAQILDVHDVMALARTRSSYLCANDATRRRMQDNLAWYLTEHLGYDKHDQIELPYTCEAWIYHCRRTAARETRGTV